MRMYRTVAHHADRVLFIIVFDILLSTFTAGRHGETFGGWIGLVFRVVDQHLLTRMCDKYELSLTDRGWQETSDISCHSRALKP